MGIDIAGATISTSGSGISLNSTLLFNSSGYGAVANTPGYSGYQASGTFYYAGTSGWLINTANWSSGLNTSTGVFTCPIAGYYAMGYNGIHNGGSSIPSVGFNTFGYSAFAKNGAISYWIHWNLSANNAWETTGTSAAFSCAAGDTLALFVNRSPSPLNADTQTYNTGMYPDNHHAVWCKLIG